MISTCWCIKVRLFISLIKTTVERYLWNVSSAKNNADFSSKHIAPYSSWTIPFISVTTDTIINSFVCSFCRLIKKLSQTFYGRKRDILLSIVFVILVIALQLEYSIRDGTLRINYSFSVGIRWTPFGGD